MGDALLCLEVMYKTTWEHYFLIHVWDLPGGNYYTV